MGIGRGFGRGYTLLAVLILVAVLSGGLALHARQISTLVQRGKEQELLFRGGQFRRALMSYAAVQGVEGAGRAPQTLDELLVDRRGVRPMHHLRQVYVDPFTGRADWVLVKSPDGLGIVGVRSRARVIPLKLRPGFPAAREDCVCDWFFGIGVPGATDASMVSPAGS